MAMSGGTAKLVHTGYGGGASNFPIKLYVYYKTSQSVADNKSTITCGMYVTTPSGWDIGSWSDFAGSYVGTTSLTFDGSIPNFSGTRWIVENKQFTVSHKDDGTGTATIKWKWGVRSTWGETYEESGSFDINLPTIARASVPTVSASSVRMKEALTITTNRKSSSFTHTLQYTFGGTTATIASSVGESHPWTVPDLASKCNNALSGKCTITCITYNGSTKVGEKTVDVTLQVPTATVPSFPNGNVIAGSSNAIATSGKSTNFQHYIEYSFNGDAGVVNATPQKSGIVWKTPAELAGRTLSDTAKGSITCTTFNGTAEVGKVTVEFTLIIPETDPFKPKITAFSVSPSGNLPSSFSGLYIQGKTGVKATFTATSTYSSIASYKLVADGRNYTGNPATSLPFAREGNYTVTGIVTDNRGFTGEKKTDIDVLPYGTPTIEPYTGYSTIICERSLQDGTYDDAGTYLHIKCRRKYSPVVVGGVQKNFCHLQYIHKVAGGSWSEAKTLLSSADTSTDVYEGILPDVVTETDKSHTIQLIVTDTIGSTETYEFPIATADVTMHLGEGGYGVAFGKYSEATPDDKKVEVAQDWSFVVDGEAVKDFVVERGTSGMWTYRKWHSGNVEAWCLATNVNGAYADSLAVPSETYIYFPFDIYSAQPHLTLTGNHWQVKKYYANTVTDKSMKIICYTEGDLLLTNISCAVHISGRWK